MPDFLGWDADKAREFLKGEGVAWTEEITEPPFKRPAGGIYKVIKQEYEEGTYRLTLCLVPDNFRA
ncbi:hypothetical protein MASR2M70_15260 [Bacillota bacterium]